MQVKTQLIGPRAVLNRHRSESSLPEGSQSLVSRIEPGRVTQVQPLHGLAQVRLRGLYDGVVVGIHQRERMDTELITHMHFAEQVKKVGPVLAVCKYPASLRTSMKYVIPSVSDPDSQMPRHASQTIMNVGTRQSLS
jgi:hypothetical protein